MAIVKEEYISRILNGILFDAVGNLNMVKDALDPREMKVIAQINEITKLISEIEV